MILEADKTQFQDGGGVSYEGNKLTWLSFMTMCT